jgi:cytochrome c
MLARIGLGLAVLLGSGAVQAQGDGDRGMAVFMSNCAACHSIMSGRHRRGPSLAGVVGRTAGSVEEFQYSSTLEEEDFEWNEATLFEYLTTPTQRGGGDEALVHGVAMGFEGLDAQSVDDEVPWRLDPRFQHSPVTSVSPRFPPISGARQGKGFIDLVSVGDNDEGGDPQVPSGCQEFGHAGPPRWDGGAPAPPAPHPSGSWLSRGVSNPMTISHQIATQRGPGVGRRR